jgi:hypothetical protein
MDMARQFHTVLTVVEKGSVGKAAETPKVSQPALTESIRRGAEPAEFHLGDARRPGIITSLENVFEEAHLPPPEAAVECSWPAWG